MPPNVHLPKALSPQGAAAYLGVHISTFYRKIYPHVRSGEIQSIMIGRARRILVASLDVWVERQARYTAHMDHPYTVGGTHG